MLGTCFLMKPCARCSARGTPWIARGSLIRLGSNLVGIRVTTVRYSPGNLALGAGTEAVRHMWSEVSPRYVGILSFDGAANPEALLDAPCDIRMVDRRENPVESPGRPRAFLAMMISSKRRIDACVAECVSRS